MTAGNLEVELWGYYSSGLDPYAIAQMLGMDQDEVIRILTKESDRRKLENSIVSALTFPQDEAHKDEG